MIAELSVCSSRPFTSRRSCARDQKLSLKFVESYNRGGRASTSVSAGLSSEVSTGFGVGSAPWEVLQSIGIRNKAEVARILDIAENPKSVLQSKHEKDERGNPLAKKLDVNEDMKPLLKFLLNNGFTKEEVPKVIIDYPIILCYSPEERLAPFFKYLKSIGISKPDRLVLRRPSVLGMDADNGLKRIVEYLQQNDHTPEQIEELLATTL